MDTEYINIGDPVINSPVGRGVITGFSKEGYPKINGQSAAWCIRTDKLAYNPRGAGGVQGQLQQGPRLAAPAPLVPMQSELPPAPAPAAPAPAAPAPAAPAPAAPPPPVRGSSQQAAARPVEKSPALAAPYGVSPTAIEPMTTADFNPPAVPGDTPFTFEKVEIPNTDSAFLERQRVSDYYETPSPTPAPAPESSPAPEPSPSPSSSSDF